jgi:hypothetical protein
MAELTGLSDAELVRRLQRLHAAREKSTTMQRTADRPKNSGRNGHAGRNGRAPTKPAPPPPRTVETASNGDGRDGATGECH